MHAWPAKYLRLLSLHMLLFDHGRFGGHRTADHVDRGGRQVMAGGVGKRKDTGRLSTTGQIKTPEILNVFGFQFFLLLCEGYSLKEYPFLKGPSSRTAVWGQPHVGDTPKIHQNARDFRNL